MLEQQIKKDRFEEILHGLTNTLFLYENKHYSSKRFNLFLANGEKINYSIPENVLAHILGVNTTYLQATSLLSPKSSSSIDILRELCDEMNWYLLYNNVSNGVINLKQLFSDYIDKKISIFADNIKPIIYNIEFVCKIDRNKIHSQGKDYMDIDYLICSKDYQGRYLVLGIINNGYNYVPRSSQIYETQDELIENLKDILYEQEMTLVTGLKLYNVDEPDYKYNPFILSSDNKKEKLTALKNYKDIFSTNIDLTQDYTFILSQNSCQRLISKAIVESMKQQEIIDMDDLNMRFQVIPEALKIIIEQYNDTLCSRGNIGANEKYSELAEENRRLKDENQSLSVKYNDLQIESNNVKQKIEQLEIEKESLLSCVDEISKALTKIHK